MDYGVYATWTDNSKDEIFLGYSYDRIGYLQLAERALKDGANGVFIYKLQDDGTYKQLFVI